MDFHTLAFYNVENFYDVNDDPKTLDDEFTFQGKRSWTKERYRNKLIRISKTLSFIGENEIHKKPTFIGLCEVENSTVLNDLIHQEFLKDQYKFVHQDSLDERGIDTAFIYDYHQFEVVKTDFLRFPVYNADGTEDTTRDITYVCGMLKQTRLHFFVVHLPSKRDSDVNLPKRIRLLEKLREYIEKILAEEPDANIVIMGDFNENPKEPYLYETLHCRKRKTELENDDFFNPSEELHLTNNFSLMHNGKGHLFDQIIFSASFFKEKNEILWKKSNIYNPFFLQESERSKLNYPFRTYSGSRYLGGYSDHFPVYSVIIKK